MSILNRKSHFQRLLDTVGDALDGYDAAKLGVPGAGRGSAFKSALPHGGKALKAAMPSSGKARKAGLVAGGLAGLTATSAGISSLRRRNEGARDDS